MIIETNLEKQQPTRVLIIDDSLESVRLMSHILDHYKCETTMAFDGQDAIPLLVHRHYDLIVLDWQMPQLGGRDTLLLMDRLLTEKKNTQDSTTYTCCYLHWLFRRGTQLAIGQKF